MRLKTVISVLLLVTIAISCNKNDTPAPPDPCLGVNYNFQYFKTEAVGALNNGTILINAPVGDTISYKIGTGNFQSSNYFTNLAPGKYVITVKNQKDCTDTLQLTILNYGPKYAAVKQVIAGISGIGGFCGPCHLNGGNSGGRNYDTDAGIINAWDRIKARAVDSNPSQMPELPNAPLSAADKQKITDWVNAGHRISD
jgi:hypothetical protein